MKKIILACSQANQYLAEQLQRDLGPAGLQLEIVTEQSSPLASALSSYTDPILLIVTDNFLSSAGCLQGLLPVLQDLIRQGRIVPVIADGIAPDTREPVPTSIDRMADMLHYLNHWQNIYLDLITRQQQLPADQRAQLEPKLQEAQAITGQVGDIITALKDTLYFSWPQITGGNYKLFFQQFDILELYERFQQSKQATPPVIEEKEEPALAEVEESSHTAVPHVPPPPPGPVRFIPVEEEEEKPVQAPFGAMETLIQDMQEESSPVAPGIHTPPPGESDMQRTIDDAWLWIRNGHLERGLEVFQFALEQYPHHEKLRTEYLLALSRHARSPEAAERQLEILHDNGIEEAKSYDLMGEIAQTKGDYLFAKYAWDRALQINPEYPGLYRKLGMMASEHLPDYRETAIHYLKAALQKAPDDPDINFRLGQLLVQMQDTEEARLYLEKALEADPQHGLARGLLDKLAPSPEPAVETPPAIEAPEEQLEPVATLSPEPEQAPPATPVAEEPEITPQAPAPVRTDIKTVMITGATSGIGRATAEIFAQNGHRVILTGRRADRLEALKNRFEDAYKNENYLLSFDIRDPLAVVEAVTQLPEEWKSIDILINNAGLAKGFSPIHEGQLDHWENMIDTNIKGLLYITRLIAPGMVERRHGHIINIGSSAGKEAYPNGNVYCATKFAVDALTKAMRMDLYTHNVRVSQVSPGHVEETEFALTRFDGDAEKARIYDEFQPLKAPDVAEVIYFIASRPPHVNVQDIYLFSSQQAASTMIHRSGRD